MIRRVIELRHLIVKWCPPKVSLRLPPPASESPFPWEYVNLDRFLIDLKLPPSAQEVCVCVCVCARARARVRSRVQGVCKQSLSPRSPIALKTCTPKYMQVPVPRYIKENNEHAIRFRDNFLSKTMKVGRGWFDSFSFESSDCGTYVVM